MILILVQFSVVILAALGLNSLWQIREKENLDEIKKKIKIYIYAFTSVAGSIFFYLLVAKSSIIEQMVRSGKRIADNPQLQEQSYIMAKTDGVLMIVFLAIGIVLLLAFLNRKIKKEHFLYGIIGITVFNLWIVDR